MKGKTVNIIHYMQWTSHDRYNKEIETNKPLCLRLRFKKRKKEVKRDRL